MKSSLTIASFAIMMITACVKQNPAHVRGITVNPGESIQAAVDKAMPGQTIYIKPGLYEEAVLVNKANITIIGLRGGHDERVIIKNPGDEENGFTVRDNGDGFVLKNVTVQDFEENGVFLVRVSGFELADITTINNGEYGLFPVRCSNGLIENCSATGHTDTGIYVGQSENIIVRKSVAFGNVNGFEIENCSDILVAQNDAYDNAAGMLIILLPGLTVKTSANIAVAENNINSNNHPNFAPPGEGFESVVPSGSGILIVGVDNVLLKNNKITNNNFVGAAVVSTLVLGALAGLSPEAFADIEPNPDGANIINNKVTGNGSNPPAGLPLPGVDLLWDGSGNNNCWKNNDHQTSYPQVLPACL
jgi:parallel beta-helix repeat protein